MKSHKGLSVLLVVAGLLLVLVAGVYFVQPASDLPTFLPGHDPSLSRHHATHGLAAMVVAVVCLIGAWMVAPRPQRRER